MAAPLGEILVRNYFVRNSTMKCFRSIFQCKRTYEVVWNQNTTMVSRINRRYLTNSPEHLRYVLSANRDIASPREFRAAFRQVDGTLIPCRPSSFRRHFTAERSRYSEGSQQKSSGHASLAIGIGGFALCSAGLLFSLWRDDKAETIEKLIAKAMIAERENRLGDADEFYHQATVMCETEKNAQALLYTYDQMANFNMRHGRLVKAEKLFKETLKLLLSSGISQEDPGVVEISLKLAKIFERMGRNEEADTGFKWCIETSEKLLKDTPDDSTEESHSNIMNLKSLLGMCVDAYARFLGVTNKLPQAEKFYKKALEICEVDLKVDGTPHPQTVVLLNDLGTICDMRGHYDEAAEHVTKAQELAEKSSPSVLPTILCNMASIRMHQGKKEEAKVLYQRALKQAQKDGDREATITIRANLQKVL